MNRTRWGIHLLLLIGYIVAIGAIRTGRSDSSGPVLSGNPRDLVLISCVQIAIFAAIFGLAWLASRASRDDLLLRSRNGLWFLPLGVGYSIALRLVLALILMVITVVVMALGLVNPDQLQEFLTANGPRPETIFDVPAMRANPVYFWFTVTFVSFVLAGLREELWRSAVICGLRKLWPRFGSRWGQIGAVAIAAIFFGFGHLPQGVIAVGATTIIGFGLGLIMVLHRSIWPAVIAHGMFDATTLALLPWASEFLHQLRQAPPH